MAKLNQYEAMFLFPPTGSMDLQGCLDFAKQMIERHGGQIIVLKKWDERKLCYEIGGQKRGLYIIAYFRAPGEGITHLERDAKLSEQVLRIMVQRADHLNEVEMPPSSPNPSPRRGKNAPRGKWTLARCVVPVKTRKNHPKAPT